MQSPRSIRDSLPLVVVLALAASVRAQEKSPAPLFAQPDVKTAAPAPEHGPGLPIERSARPATASVTTHSAPRRSRVPRATDRIETARPGDGMLWVRGGDYKARFDATGVEFVPRLGPRSSGDASLRFTLAAASVGETPLDVTPSAAPEQHGDRVDVARRDLLERWELRSDALEQEFVLDALPGAGDLRLEIAVATGLEPRALGDGLRFAGDLGGVDYGAATAVDANGRHFALSTTWNGASIELVLGADALASARLPLVVDPLVSTFAIDLSASPDYSPDVAYDAGSDTYLVVYEEEYSSVDHDVYAERIDANGAVLAGGYVDFTTDDWTGPRVACNRLAQSFLCVATVGSGSAPTVIRGAIWDVANAIGAQFTISGAESGAKLHADVGGDPALAPPTYFLVVWERTFSSSDSDVHARLVDGSGALVGPGTILVDNTSGSIDTHPAISKSDGNPPFATQNWTIVWERDYFGVHQQVFGAQYHWDGIQTHATFPVDATSDVVLNPRVSSLLDGDGVTRPYMVAMEAQNGVSGHWDVIGLMFQDTTFLVGTDVQNQLQPSSNGRDDFSPVVDSDGRHFSYAYCEVLPQPLIDEDLYVADIVYAGGYPEVCSGALLAGSGALEYSPAITSTYSGGGARLRYGLAWTSYDFASSGATPDIYGATWDGAPGGCVMATCFGDGSGTTCPCGNSGASGNGCASSVNAAGANLAWSGDPWVSNDTFQLVASGMPNGSSLFFQGSLPVAGSSGVAFGDGLRCAGGSIVRLATKLNAGGASTFPDAGDPPVHVRGSIPATGAYRWYQVWYRNAASFCTAATYNLTNGLAVIYAP